MIALIEGNLDAVRRFCREFDVARLEVIGSAATGAFRDGSDLAESLEALFGRSVDLLTERSIRNPYFRRQVEATRQVVYDGRGQEAAA